MNLSEFLKQFIEGYLFEDLQTMVRDPKPPTNHGHLGYPMLMSCAAGIEMLGILASTKFQPSPAPNFLRYWRRYLYPVPPRKDVGDAVYQLVRHGIAHNFAAKQPFKIYKSLPSAPAPGHLVNVGDETLIDATQLFVDLRASYESRFLPVATGKAAAATGEGPSTMQLRLDDLIKANEEDMKTHGGPLKKLPPLLKPIGPSPVQISTATPGASGGLPPGAVAPASSSAGPK